MDSEIILAIVALLATIGGATIGAATNIVLAERRDRADGERTETNAIEVKRAARLIDAELSRAQAAARIYIEKRHWWSADVPQLSTETWQKYCGILAPDLSDQAWLDLRVAFEAIDNIRVGREIVVDAGLAANAIFRHAR